ncbi:hypothetical protein E2F46_10525 [Luteimonas aestuarii]|uniref:Uncharacterized protein n=1 Tax=Luteimonas aestuarii TaxID=453837 RepID=A0A4R5TR91_9GAMM|nr:hypothetical protein [Luteimonas aestuarii]TDK23352.1 hypothetical protein E2F46_10525 [Luteimonas aestuarii]
MKNLLSGRTILAFIAAVLLAIVVGALVQSHYNLQALASIGVDVDGVRIDTMMRDLFSGFSPTYGGYIVAPALLVAFLVAGWLSGLRPGLRIGLYMLGGYLAVLAAIPLVNFLSPVALLVGASRETSATFLMAVGGALGGLLFAFLTRPAARRRDSREEIASMRAMPR